MKSISVGYPVANDLPQWYGVPYYLDAVGETLSGSGNTDIKKVYLSNDSNNLYIRIVNASGILSAYQQFPKFGIQLYSEDLKHNSAVAARAIGLNGGTLARPMQYLVSRTSDSSAYTQSGVVNGSWTSVSSIGKVIAPQWDPATGNIELVVPLSAISSTGYGNSEDWANMIIVLSEQPSSTSPWQDDDQIAVHYRITAPTDTSYYGNVE